MGGSGVAEEKAAVAAAGPSLGPKLQRPRVLFISIFETLSVAVVVQREGGRGRKGQSLLSLTPFPINRGLKKVAGGNCHNHFQSKYKIHLVAVIEFKVCFLLYHTEYYRM